MNVDLRARGATQDTKKNTLLTYLGAFPKAEEKKKKKKKEKSVVVNTDLRAEGRTQVPQKTTPNLLGAFPKKKKKKDVDVSVDLRELKNPVPAGPCWDKDR